MYYLPSTRSTMEEALRLLEGGCPTGTVVAAGFQERGRGRCPDRSWEAEAGRNLLFTLILELPPGFPPQRLPILAGLALARALEGRFGLKTAVKWPNDLLHGGRKLAGILCEARARPGGPTQVLVGIGVNCNQLSFPRELKGRACCLRELLGAEVALPELLAAVLAAIHAALGDGGWREALEARLHGLGCPAVLRDGGRAVRGIVRGVAEDGALLLESGGRVGSFYNGELAIQAEA